MVRKEDLISSLGLMPLPGEGGYYRFNGVFGEGAGSILYLATGESFSSLHLLSRDELWFLLSGSEAEQLVLDPLSGKEEVRVLSSSNPVSLVKGGLWQATRPRGGWTLFSTVMSPRYSDSDYTAPGEDLLSARPHLRRWLNA